jgi:hypothetical protein
MGMKKISKTDQDNLVRSLRTWDRRTPLNWEALRNQFAISYCVELNQVWSRQSLSANPEIYDAFTIAKRRFLEYPITDAFKENGAQQQRVSELESELAELQVRYDRLLVRHAQLSYNASLLEGGSHLLDDPLPDNTKSQRGR